MTNRARHRQTGTGGLLALISFGLMFAAAGSVEAALWDPFNGFADIAAVQGTLDGEGQDSLREDYNATFEDKITPWLDLRLAYRYFKFDQAFDLEPGVYRQEKQPSGELRWTHPDFLVSGNLTRREVETQSQGTVVTNTSQAVAKTRNLRYPQLEFRYDDQHTYFADQRDLRDIRNQLWQASGKWDREHHSLNYTFSHSVTENVVSAQRTTGNRHLARWRGQGSARDGRLRLAGNYNFSSLDQSTINQAGGAVLRLLPLLAGLYTQSATPDLAALEPRPGLVDGNVAAATIPPIDLGGANIDHNLGVDLGSVRPVGAFYVFTDGPSSDQVRWDVWSSDDNLIWRRRVANPRQIFNVALNRYELVFAAVSARYIKVVNSGLNDVASVRVTELQAFEELSSQPQSGLLAYSHQADGRLDYFFSEKWRGSFDVNGQIDENPGRDGDRARGAAGVRANYMASPSLTHTLHWQLSQQWYDSDNADLTESSAGYSAIWTPLPTLRGSASASDRLTWLGGQRAQRNTGLAVEGNTDLLYGLTLGLGSGVSWDQNDFSDRQARTWNLTSRLDAALTSFLDLSLDSSYYESLETTTDDLRVRRVFGLGFDWRISRTIFARATVRDTRDESQRYTVDGLLTWNLLPSLRVSAQRYELGTDLAVTTLRESVNLNWEWTSRTSLYLRVAKLDLSGGGGTRTTSFQQGFRTSF